VLEKERGREIDNSFYLKEVMFIERKEKERITPD
jgi:hypothetical protein